MRFYNRPHQYYCGIDLHVKTMYVCILDGAGQVLVHRNIPSTPTLFLEVVAPYRADLVVAAEWVFAWRYGAAGLRLCGRDANGAGPAAPAAPLGRKRGQLLAHIQNSRAQYHLPAFEKRVAYPGNRDGGVQHFPGPSVRKSIEVDVVLID